MSSSVYEQFIEAKRAEAAPRGFEPPLPLSEVLFSFQRDIVAWACRQGRAGIFASFGLGKTLVQLEIARQGVAHTRGRALIVAPLGVRQEFRRDAEKIGVPIRFVRRLEECDPRQIELGAEGVSVYLTNYETVRDGKIDPREFELVLLDEAACLRGFGGTKTFRELMATMAGDDRRDMSERKRDEGVRYRFVATATPSPNDYIELLAYSAFLGVMDVGAAKAQPLDAKVLTPTGWKLMGAVSAGDMVIAGDGTATRVLGVYPQGERPIYKVTFSDGGSAECDADHLWLTKTPYEREKRRATPSDGVVRTTTEIAASLMGENGLRHSVPLVGAVQFERRPVAIDPWLLGILIGDASLRESSVTLACADDWILGGVTARLPAGIRIKHLARYNYGLGSGSREGIWRAQHTNQLLNDLRGYGLAGKRAWEKRVPQDYIFNDVETRLGVLRGLMDSDGHAPKARRDSPRFVTTSHGLALDVQMLARSLGGEARITGRPTQRRRAYVVTVRMPRGMNPFSLPRKADLWKPSERLSRFIKTIEPVGTKPAQCIAIEHPSRLYVTDDFAVTHNTRFFKRNSEKADHLTIHEHKQKEFWLWVASWAVFVTRPSDINETYSDDGYVLPELDVHWHELPSDHANAGQEKDGQQRLLQDSAIGVTNAAREKRDSLDVRMAKLLELRAIDPAAHRLIWHDLEAERAAIEAAIPTARTVYGSQDLETREEIVCAFADGQLQEMAGKPSLLGAGVNVQRHCSWAIYLGIGFRFHEFVQSVHRIQRFLQSRRVRVDLIYTEAEREVRRTLERKWEQHRELVAQMTKIVREYGLGRSALHQSLERAHSVARIQESGKQWTMVNNDCVLELEQMPADSVDLVVTSIPFSQQYEYSPSYLDFGHTDNNQHFWCQMDFLIPQLARVLKPGRVASIHVKDRIVPGGMKGLGFQTVYPFHADCIRAFERHGLHLIGMKTIVTDVVRENNQTYRLGWTEQCKDGSRMGFGMPEYLLRFRKPPTDNTSGRADEPVVKTKEQYSRGRWQLDAHGFARSSGNRLLTADDLVGIPHERMFKLFREHSLRDVYDYERHVKLCESVDERGMLPVTFMLLQPQSWHPDVWTDVARMRTLNSTQASKGREMHLCPLQFDIVDREITQLSQENELILDPFAGLGTVPYCAVRLGRRGLGVELSQTYFADAVTYCKAAERALSAPTLFDLDPVAEAG